MKKPSLLVVVSSLLVGGICTLMFLAQMSWQPQPTCKEPGSTVQVDGCAAMTYGYPKRFIFTDVRLDSYNAASAVADINIPNLLYNWLVWSGVSFLALYAITNHLPQSSKKKK